MPELIDLTGRRFGKWVVLGRASNGKNGNTRWLCRCDCGRERIVYGQKLRSDKSRQCKSCARRENKNALKHGQWGTALYIVWYNMIKRCENPKNPGYKNYGGKGIRICSQWHDLALFIAWALSHGYRDNLTIDRIDNDGNYEPGNCQWITKSENSLKAWRVDGSHGEKYLKAS